MDPRQRFTETVDQYQQHRPDYPLALFDWLERCVSGRRAADLGCGTGILTRMLAARGWSVVGVEPNAAMRAAAIEKGGATYVDGTAEATALPSASYDLVIGAQAFHWFDLDRALPEIARVLRPGGRLCLVWNQRDEKIPWVRRLGALIGTQEQLRDPAEALIFSELFGFVEDREFSHWQTIDRRTIQDLVLSRSNVAVLDEAGRAAKLAEVLAFYDDFGRGMDGMQLPYVTRCFTAHVLDRPDRPLSEASDEHADGDRPPDDPDAELLIDFR